MKRGTLVFLVVAIAAMVALYYGFKGGGCQP